MKSGVPLVVYHSPVYDKHHNLTQAKLRRMIYKEAFFFKETIKTLILVLNGVPQVPYASPVQDKHHLPTHAVSSPGQAARHCCLVLKLFSLP